MIQITNTLKTGETKLPEPGSKIRMFACGPTVYDFIHIGNARTFVVFDVIAKYLRYRNYDVNYIQNITDIDDKIMARARKDGMSVKESAEKFEKIFLDNMKSLKVDSVDKYPRATDHIPEIIRQAKTLVEKGSAYLVEGDGYYFDLKTFPEYGKLSGRTAEMAEDAVSRIDESSGKRNRGDFCLWKFSKEGEPSWESELGAGRPGWHIEDTAITEKYFGPQYEIHGGGQDLIFPHHEAEIAQQESASGKKPFVRFWLHSGLLVTQGGKMSKSLGNFMTVDEALKKYSPEALRFYFLSAHYRSPLDYSEKNLKQAEAAVARLGEFVQKLKLIKEDGPEAADGVKKLETVFEESMDNDFNVPAAMGYVFNFMAGANPQISAGTMGRQSAQAVLEFLDKINGVLGVVPTKFELPPPETQKLIDEREEARERKDFTRADELRGQIKNLGYEVGDTIYGPLVKRIEQP
jgi:cysteinyl-tRNA synthetase